MEFKDLPSSEDFLGFIPMQVSKNTRRMIVKAIDNAKKNAWNNAIVTAAENAIAVLEPDDMLLTAVVDKESILDSIIQ